MNETQFAVLRSLMRAVEAVKDSFGSEATSSGLVFPNDCESLAEASRAFLPGENRLYPVRFEALIERHVTPADSPAIHAFIEIVRHFPHEVAYLAPPTFKPDAHSRGAFLISLFLATEEAAGVNLLVAFERVET